MVHNLEMASLPSLPPDPFLLTKTPAFQPAGRRQLQLFQAEVELCWLPDRSRRQGIADGKRPAILPPRGQQIIQGEAFWENQSLALTPNLFPFGQRQILGWAKEPCREAPLALLDFMFRLQSQCQGAVMLNSLGAAASIAHCHLHLLDERLPFLGQLANQPLPAAELGLAQVPSGVQFLALQAPFPVLGIGIQGDAEDRAAAAHQVLLQRSTPAFNLVGQDDICWIFPRSIVETPAPYFPQALGAAEFWGRWCYMDQEAFETASSQDLEQALRLAGYPRPGPS